jgi:hypothetical protein
MTKVLYFTASDVPTSNELAEINVLKNYPGIELGVRNASKLGVYGSAEPADYVAGYNSGAAIPAPYNDTEDYPLTSAAQPPAPTVLGTQKVITSGVEFLSPAVGGSRTDGYTPTIADGVVTALTGS